MVTGTERALLEVVMVLASTMVRNGMMTFDYLAEQLASRADESDDSDHVENLKSFSEALRYCADYVEKGRFPVIKGGKEDQP